MTETKRELNIEAMIARIRRSIKMDGVPLTTHDCADIIAALTRNASLELKLQSALEYIKEDKCTCKGHQDKLSGEWDLDMCARCGLIKELEST